jgi:hypothetical protein
MADTTTYTALITSEYQNSPKFLGMIAAVAAAFVDNQNLIASLPTLFDIDTAVGDQLDKVGERVGRSRYLKVPLANVYFSWGTAGLGWNQGIWYEPFNPTTGMTRLPDDEYRVLLYATVAANQWDGTIPGAYAAWQTIFAPMGIRVLIQDYGDMSMAIALIGPTLSAVTFALFTAGELDLRPAGVRLAAHLTQTVVGAPLFGWGVQNENIAGWGVGAWGHVSYPE